jgi:hypothetical protein
VVFAIVTSRISSDHCAKRGCGIGNRNLMNLGWSGSLVGFIADCEDGWMNGIRMVVLTLLWSKKACGMVCVSLACEAIWRRS